MKYKSITSEIKAQLMFSLINSNLIERSLNVLRI